MNTLARRLRQDMNFPERKAWEALRLLRRRGFAVRRQHPVEHYVLDFAITRLRLAIEIDGGIHDLPQVQARDATREARLRELGWRVLRVPARTALSPDHLLALVEAYLPLTPTPLPAGERGLRPCA